MKNLRLGARMAISVGAAIVVIIGLSLSQLSDTKAMHAALAAIAGPRWREIDLAAKGIGVAGENASLAGQLFLTTDAAASARLLDALERNGRLLAEIERDAVRRRHRAPRVLRRALRDAAARARRRGRRADRERAISPSRSRRPRRTRWGRSSRR